MKFQRRQLQEMFDMDNYYQDQNITAAFELELDLDDENDDSENLDAASNSTNSTDTKAAKKKKGSNSEPTTNTVSINLNPNTEPTAVLLTREPETPEEWEEFSRQQAMLEEEQKEGLID